MDEWDAPPIGARHLLVCLAVEYDPDAVGAAYSLGGLVTSLRPEDDFGYPLIVERLYLFAQVFGEPGEYTGRITLWRIDDEGVGAEVEVARYSPAVVRVRPGQFVEGAAFPLYGVTFARPGLYEFRLTLGGPTEPLVSERLYLAEG